MTSVLSPPIFRTQPSRDSVPEARHICLHGIDWDAFELILQGLEGQRLRLSYDRGSLELMVVGPFHESGKSHVRKLVDVLTEELNLDVESYGSMTWRRRDKDRAIELDECWYIQHAAQMRGKREINFEVDPPPDLALEIEVSRTVLDRLSIYEALRVPEIWRSDGTSVRFLRLREDGRYEEVGESATFPGLRPGDLARFLAVHAAAGELSMIREFRAWVREQFRNAAQGEAP